MMNGSNVANTTTAATTPAKSKEDQVVNGHDEKENNPFAEYMWMENEEDFNRQVEEELQEQEFLDRCFQEMLDEEDQDWFIPSRDLPQGIGQLQQQLNGLSVNDGTHSHVSEDILVSRRDGGEEPQSSASHIWEGRQTPLGGSHSLQLYIIPFLCRSYNCSVPFFTSFTQRAPQLNKTLEQL
uniref:Uncharacterized protein n=1 Tax=Anolis carolinensis TaxID=28377 RepID=R4GD73_ANOCA